MKKNEASFEEAMSDLESLVRKLEEGQMPLNEAISAYEKGTELKKVCEEKLKNAKLKVEKIMKDSSGKVNISE